MENTVTLSQMADTIIVMSFFVLVIIGVTFTIAEAVSSVIDMIKEHRWKRREQKAKKLEDNNEQATSE